MDIVTLIGVYLVLLPLIVFIISQILANDKKRQKRVEKIRKTTEQEQKAERDWIRLRREFCESEGFDTTGLEDHLILNKANFLEMEKEKRQKGEALRKHQERQKNYEDRWRKLKGMRQDIFEIFPSYQTEKYVGVFAIRFFPSGKFYIDSSTNIIKRLNTELVMLDENDHPSPELQNAYNENYDNIRYFVVSLWRPISQNSDPRHFLMVEKECCLDFAFPPLNNT